MKNTSQRTDEEISQMKEWIIQQSSLSKSNEYIQSYLRGQMVMLIWFTSDLRPTSCYEKAKKLLGDDGQNG